jgi:hypothetical protein
MMKLKIEIPILIDGRLTADERRQFKAWLRTVVKGETEKLCGPGAHVYHRLPVRLLRA